MTEEKGFYELLGIRKERLIDLYHKGLEAQLGSAMAAIENAAAKAVAVRALISKFPEVIEAERKYETLAKDRIYPVDPTRDYKATDPEGCAEAIHFCNFRSQEDFELMMNTAISLRETYNEAYKKCSSWGNDIVTGVPRVNGFEQSQRVLRERLVIMERIGIEAIFIIPELVRSLDDDINVYLQSAKVRELETAKYDPVVKRSCYPLSSPSPV